MHPALKAISEQTYLYDLHPFRLFCVYHLGLDDQGCASFKNAQQAARELQVNIDQMSEALASYRMSAEIILHSDFDLASAQADISLSPTGVDLPALAQMHFEHFLNANENARDWSDEINDDASANQQDYKC